MLVMMPHWSKVVVGFVMSPPHILVTKLLHRVTVLSLA